MVMQGRFIPIILIVIITLVGCGGAPAADTDSSAAPADMGDTAEQTAGRILWVDSYHEGLVWSDGIEAGLMPVLEDANVEVQVIHMDTRNNRAEEFCMNAGEEILAVIEDFDPDVLIATDDNAQKCLVVPHLMDSELPIVFAAVNWDASVYGYPNEHITGMVEIELVESMIGQLEEYADGDRLAYLSVDSTTDRKTATIYNERFFDDELTTFFVETYGEFQAAYRLIQEEADMLILGNYTGIEGWEDEEALAFIVENTQIPSSARLPGPDRFALVSFLKRGEEQGQAAAEMALQILAGTPVTDIPVVENKFGDLALHLDLAEKLDITFSPSMLRNATILYGAEDE